MSVKACCPRLLLVFLLLTLLSLSLAPASAKGGLCEPYKTLVFEGGGVRGVIYPGALIALHEAGLLQTVQNFAGTSAGSGTAALLALGFSACELREEVEEYSFHELVDFSLPKALRNAFFGIEAGTLFSKLAAKKGFFSGDKLERKFDMIIQRKLCSKALGLSTVRELPANSIHLAENGDCAKYKQATFASALDGNIELKLTGFDITHGRLRWFSRETTPNMPISKAIRISSGIPFIFEPVEYDGALYLDGGVLRNVPVDAFPKENMLVLRIGQNFVPTEVDELQRMSLYQYTRRMLKVMATNNGAHLDLVQKTKFEKVVEFVEFTKDPMVLKQSAFDFDITFSQKAKMVELGYSIMRSYLHETFKNCIVHENGKAAPDNTASVAVSKVMQWLNKKMSVKYTPATCATPACFHNLKSETNSSTERCKWIEDMHQSARAKDKSLEQMKQRDLGIPTRIFVFGCIVVVLTWCTGQARNWFHQLLINKYSGIRTSRCEACKRRWVPSELSYREVNKLPPEELDEALESRGMLIDVSEHVRPCCVDTTAADVPSDKDETIRLKRRFLRGAVYAENISFRRPWSLLYHASICPCRWTSNFPIDEKIVVLVAMYYLLSMSSTLSGIVVSEKVSHPEL